MSQTPKQIRTQALPTIAIGTNNYTEAKTRVSHVAKNFDYEVETDVQFIEALRLWIVKATVTIYEDGRPFKYQGTAKEYENKIDGDVNSTSALENAETSAVGRALAFAGIGIDNGIASGDEIKAVQRAGGTVKGTNATKQTKAAETSEKEPPGNNFKAEEFLLDQIQKCETQERLKKIEDAFKVNDKYEEGARDQIAKAIARRKEALKKQAQRAANKKDNGTNTTK